ncbi:hypothetical protein ACFV0L_33010, partial [Streptosporangium canum]
GACGARAPLWGGAPAGNTPGTPPGAPAPPPRAAPGRVMARAVPRILAEQGSAPQVHHARQ